jgi:tetratricopeptide (TPR) repeat protein
MKRTSLLLFAVIGLSWSCATVKYQQDIGAYHDDIALLEAKLRTDPNDFEALRELGVIYFQTSQYPAAQEHLQKALAQNSDDPKTAFYLGLTHEFQNQNHDALAMFEKFPGVTRLSPYRRLMEGRYVKLTRAVVSQEMQLLLQNEEQLTVQRLAPKTVAVFPLTYHGTDRRFQPLGKGLAEMITIDLGQVNELTLLERLRLQTLIDEMERSQGVMFDRESAPRFGKLLSAGRIIAGSFDVLADKQLQVDMMSWDIVNQNFPDAVSQRDALNNLFRLEKEIVFGVLEEMQIELTQEERENIQRIPTQNLLAFLAYCRGLEQEDGGDFQRAAKSYQEAFKLDPAFRPAQIKSEATESLLQTAGTQIEVLDQLASVESPETSSTTETQDLVSSRLDNLSSSIGSNFVPGQDSRKAGEEASESGADLGELAEPPPPPQ